MYYYHYYYHYCYYYYYNNSVSHLRTVFTIMYPKQALFTRYTVLQLFCIYSLCCM